MKRRRSRHDEPGAVFVEFAIVLPIFLFIIFAMINYAAMMSFRQTLSQAAAEGARAAAIAPFNTTFPARQSRANAAVNEAFQGQNAACGDGWLTCNPHLSATCATAAGAECISVTLTYNYDDAVRSGHRGPRVPNFVPDPLAQLFLPTQLSYTSSARVH